METHDRPNLGPIVDSFASGTDAERTAARTALLEYAIENLRRLAHRMLRGSAKVRRWEETDDVVQGAALRLHRALEVVTPNGPREFLGLIATQVRREIIDLARKYNSRNSFAMQHETNVMSYEGENVQKVSLAEDETGETSDDIAAWSRFHEAAAGLPEEERELFDLVWFVGAEQNEIARLLGCSPRTVRRRWNETKQHLLKNMRGDRPRLQ